MDDARSRRDSTPTAFWRGFAAMLPLWAGAIPVGAAFGVAARQVGLSGGEVQAMSLLVFSAAAQIGAVSLLEEGAPGYVLVGASIALNVQLLLLGVAVGRRLRPDWSRKPLLAFLLTDGAYAVAAGRGRLSGPGLLGAGASMYLGWNLGTALGVAGGDVLPDPSRFDVELVAPLAFLAVLTPLLKSRAAWLTALVAGGTALLLGRVVPAGVAVLGAGVAGSAVGAWWADRAGPLARRVDATGLPARSSAAQFPPADRPACHSEPAGEESARLAPQRAPFVSGSFRHRAISEND
jgi:predicted branched-subunit amino acid permease